MFKKLIDAYKNIDTIETKLYWQAAPIISLTGFAALIYSMFLGESIGLTIICACFVVLMIGNIAFAYIKKNIRLSYLAMCIIVGGLVIPSSVFFCGGISSGMPLFCIIGVLMGALCPEIKSCIISTGFNLMSNAAALCASIIFPQAVIPLDEKKYALDVMVSFILLSSVASVAIACFFSEYRHFSKKISSLTKHMDSRVVPMIDGTEGDGRGKEMNIAIMFADIVGFTTVSENMTPAKSAQFLNVFFNIAEECIHKYNGIIDKYIGDCVMCYWIDNGKYNPTELACRAADEIRSTMKDKLESIYQEFNCEMRVSCGINYGAAIVGEIGSKSRLDFTVIGDAINIASRLENLAPSDVIYLSQDAANKVMDLFSIAKIQKKVVLKGKNCPVDIFALLSTKHKNENTSIQQPDEPSGFVLNVCGSRGSYSLAGNRYQDYGGETSCYIFKKDDYALIVDCGTGLQRGRDILDDCKRIDIVLTHVHYDHIIGLLDWSIFPKGAQLTFYGNFNEWLGEKTISELFRAPFWPVDLSQGTNISVDRYFEYKLRPDVSVTFYPSSHPNGANILVLKINGKKICIMADCENPDDLPLSVLRECDMLMYDGMYEEQYYNEHMGWGHSTWESGVALAQKAKVKRLVITHHNPRNSDEKLHGLELEAQNRFPSTTFAKAGDRYII